MEGTQADDPDEDDWQAYEFKGQPVDPEKRPPQWAPYHLRLDWQLWFAAMIPRPTFRQQWFRHFIDKLLEHDEDTLRLLESVSFDEAPEQIRVTRYRYEYTDWDERKETGRWWNREELGIYYGPVSRD